MDYPKENNKMIRKNKKFIDPRYFMDEKMELREGAIGGARPHEQALQRQLRDAEATSPEQAIRAKEIFDSRNGTLWAALESGGIDPREIQRIQNSFMQKYTIGTEGPLPDGKWVIAGTPNRETIYAVFN
jgi:hypothetical protein